VQVDVVLQPRNPAALAAFATAVSTPGNALFRDYLARGQFAGRFGPTAAAIKAVEGSLRSSGLPAGHLSSNHLSLTFSATAGQLSKGFSTSFEQVRMPGGRVAFTNTRAPLFSGTAARYVQGVIGLSNTAQAQRLGLAQVTTHRAMAAHPQVVTGGPQPCSAAVSAGPTNDAYTADQLASAYRFSSLYGAGDEGSGVGVALFELEPNLTTDVSAYQSCYGTSATVTYTKVDGGSGTGAGEGEAALDIEDVIGLAPKASVDVYQAPNSNAGLYQNYEAIVDNDTQKVVSTSWGECESSSGTTIISEEGTLFQQAATQGQSIYAAAGDSGSEDCGTNTLAVDDPASQPYVTGVGGTEITALGPAPTQNVWNEKANGAGAGGGGVSLSHTMPSYQSGAPASLNVINSHSSGTQCKAATGSYCREVPDVSADADPYSGYVIYYNGAWTGIGGTSAAAPLWAAFTALTDASTTCAGKAIGFANPGLYSAAAAAYSSDFNDITSGNNDYTGTNSGLYPAGTGYDMASGLGTPNGAALPAALCGGTTTGNTVTVTNPGTQTTTVGSSVSLQISATDSGGASLTYTATGLPAGLSISTAGLISGAPTAAGSSSVVVTAKDSTGASGTASFTWTVNAKAGNTVTVTNPGTQTTTVGSSVSLQISATDSGGASLTYTATGLPAGLSISTAGLISGAPTAAGSSSVVVTAKDSTGASGTASFTWTVNAASSCTASQLLGNPGFESGNTTWKATTDVILDNSEAGGSEVAQAGSYFAWLDGYGAAHTDTLSQSVALPAGCSSYTLTYYQHIDSTEKTSEGAADTLTLQVLNSSGTVLSTVSTYSNLNAASGYQLITANLAAYAGETITLKWTGTETAKGGGNTDFCIDTTSLED
jgi:subtilase family serine protease